MDERLAFAVAALEAQVEAATARYDTVRRGAGQKFFRAFQDIFADIKTDADSLIEEAKTSESREQPSIERNISRLLVDLRDHDSLMAEFASDVGRDDLPVGYMMLIDKVCTDVLSAPANHLVHISDSWDYSTSNVAGGLIIHLPAVDPSNAFWSPILVHEAAHLSFGKVVDVLNKTIGKRLEEIEAISLANPGSTKDDQTRDRLLPRWMEELYCDAVASYIAGPSFLLALSSRLVGAAWAIETDHPPAELRLAVCLDVLERTGWMALLDHEAPAVAAWAKGVAARKPSRDANVKFLFASAQVLSSSVVDLAAASIPASLLPETSGRRALEAAHYFRHSVLPVDMAHSEHIEWEFVLGAWLLALERKQFEPSAIPTVPFDLQLNGLLTKTVELARIKKLWQDDDPPR